MKKKKTEGSPEARGTYGRETGKESDEKEGEGEGKLAESTRLSVENDVHPSTVGLFMPHRS